MSGPLAGSVILVVEDEPIIAIDIARSFEDAGASVLTAHTLMDAMREVETPGLTAAVIDHALRDDLTTSDVCQRLNELNVPLSFTAALTTSRARAPQASSFRSPPRPVPCSLLAPLNKQERPALN